MLINDFPPEILTEILVCATNRFQLGGSHGHYVLVMTRKSAPLNLIHVCRYWRAIALSNQSLWRFLAGDASSPAAMAHWLSFSQSAKLHLALSPSTKFDRTMDTASLDASKQMLQLFTTYSDRWESLCFNIKDFKLTDELANILHNSALRSPLHRFEIRLWHDDTPQAIMDNLISAIASFQSLRHFSWIFNSRQSTIPHIFPWHALEVVYVDASIEVEEFIWCLMQCTSASDATLLGRPWDDKRRVTAAFNYPHSTLPNLKSLTINDDCDPFRFLRYFTLPSLSSLEILTLRGRSTALEDFFLRSQCPLRKFKVDDQVLSMTNEDIVGCLSTPYLRSVPEVKASVHFNGEKRFKDIVRTQPNILHDMPRFMVWREGLDENIGWMEGASSWQLGLIID